MASILSKPRQGPPLPDKLYNNVLQDQTVKGNYEGALLVGAHFIRCDISDVNFTHATLLGVTFEDCYYWRPPSFDGATLWSCDFRGMKALQRPGQIHTGEMPVPEHAPSFVGADLSGTTMQLRTKPSADGKPNTLALSRNFAGAFVLGFFPEAVDGGIVVPETPDYDRHIVGRMETPSSRAAKLAKGKPLVLTTWRNFRRLRAMIATLANAAAKLGQSEALEVAGAVIRAAVDDNDVTIEDVIRKSMANCAVTPALFAAKALVRLRRVLHSHRDEARSLWYVMGKGLIDRIPADVRTGLSVLEEDRLTEAGHIMLADAVLAEAQLLMPFTNVTDVQGCGQILTLARTMFSATGDYFGAAEAIRGAVSTPQQTAMFWNAHLLGLPWQLSMPTDVTPPPGEESPYELPRTARAMQGCYRDKLYDVADKIAGLFTAVRRKASGGQLPGAICGLRVKHVRGPFDASGLVFNNCKLIGCDLHLWNLRGAVFIDCDFTASTMGTVREGEVGKWKEIGRRPTQHIGPTGTHLDFGDERPVFVGCDFRGLSTLRVTADDFAVLWKQYHCLPPQRFKRNPPRSTKWWHR